jgi:hypothetical protein
MVPLGVWMEMGWVATRTLMTGASIVQKWAVLPVSAIAGAYVMGTDGGVGIGAGGPIAGAEGGTSRGTRTAGGIAFTDGVIVLGEQAQVGGAIGFPPGQDGGAVAGGVAPPRGERPPPRRMVLLPPIMWRAVAVIWWPSAGRWHEALVWLRLVPRPCVQQ